MSDIQEYKGPVQLTPDHFARAYPRMEEIAKGNIKGGVQHGPQTVQRLNDMHAQMRMNPPKPATVLNFHPFPLKVNGGHLFAGIEIPACNPGEPFAYKHIRGYKWDWKEEADEEGTITPVPVFPIQLAREFAREFNGTNGEQFGHGILVYEGDGNPLKVKDVETYDAQGLPIMVEEVLEVETPEGQKALQRVDVPVKRALEQLIKEARGSRNDRYLKRVQAANQDYNLPNGTGRKNITDLHLKMAEVLVLDGRLREMPSWKLGDRSTEGYEQDNCPVCAEARKTGAIVCKGCNYVYDPFKAYELSIIEWGNLAMERMTSDEWEEAERIKADREAVRAKVGQKAPKGKQAKHKEEKAEE